MLILTQVEVIVEVLVELGNSKKIFWFEIVLVNTMSDKKNVVQKYFNFLGNVVLQVVSECPQRC